MNRNRRSKVLWALWMSGGGLAIAAAAYGLTGSAGWAILALFASGVVLNAIAQIVIQPIKAATAGRSKRRTHLST
jgi:hypothetical protein